MLQLMLLAVLVFGVCVPFVIGVLGCNNDDNVDQESVRKHGMSSDKRRFK